jgi:hypothetical protein
MLKVARSCYNYARPARFRSFLFFDFRQLSAMQQIVSLDICLQFVWGLRSCFATPLLGLFGAVRGLRRNVDRCNQKRI